MSSSTTFPKIDFIGSLQSHEESSIKTENSNDLSNEQTELIKFQKLKQFHNITKYEQLINVPSVASVNSLQDPELNELLRAIDNLIYLSLENIHKTDKALRVDIENFKMQSNQFESSANNSKTETVVSEPEAEVLNINLKYLNAKFLKSKPEPLPKIDPVTIENIVSLDFLRNGMKSGTFQTQKFYTTTFFEQEAVSTNTVKDLSSGISDTFSNSSRESLYNKTIYSIAKTLKSQYVAVPNRNVIEQTKRESYKAMTSNTNKKLLIFKFLLVFNLSNQCFELKQVNEKELTYTVGIKEKPHNWEINDYETLTLLVKSESILKKKGDNDKKTRHLNAKGFIYLNLFLN